MVKDKKIKLLTVIADASQTGAPTQVLYLLKGLPDHFEKTLICPDGWLATQAKKIGVKIVIIPGEYSRLQLRKFLSDQYFKLSPDIIHFHGVRAGIVGCLATTPIQSKLIYTEHLWTADFHLPNRWREWMQLALLKSVCRKVDRVVAVSKATEKFMVKKKIAASSKIKTIYGAIEPIEVKTHISDPVIGTIGRITWIKGVNYLLRALPIVQRSVPNIKCVIGGDGPDRQVLQKLAKRLKVSDRVVWFNDVKHREKFYQAINIYVQPSLSESFGMAPLEAMSCGVPAVVSSVGALPEVVDDGKNGLVFPKKDIKALAQQIIKLEADKELYQQLSIGAKRSAGEYSVRNLATNYEHLYLGLIKR